MQQTSAWSDFESALLPQLAKHFPLEAWLMGRDGLRELAVRGAEGAAAYGVSLGPHVAQYVQLCLALGVRFDCDPLLPWASTILRSRSLKGADARLRELNAAALDYVKAVAGWNGRRYRRVFLTMRSIEYGQFPAPGRAPAKELIPFFKFLFPEKAAHAAASLPVFVDWAVRSGRRFGLDEGRPLGVYASLMFLLGQGFSDDPQFPWAREVLERKPGDSPEKIASALTTAGHLWVERVLSLPPRP